MSRKAIWISASAVSLIVVLFLGVSMWKLFQPTAEEAASRTFERAANCSAEPTDGSTRHSKGFTCQHKSSGASVYVGLTTAFDPNEEGISVLFRGKDYYVRGSNKAAAWIANTKLPDRLLAEENNG